MLFLQKILKLPILFKIELKIKLTSIAIIKKTMRVNNWLLQIPAKILNSSFNFLALKKFNICINTKTLNIYVKCLECPIS